MKPPCDCTAFRAGVYLLSTWIYCLNSVLILSVRVFCDLFSISLSVFHILNLILSIESFLFPGIKNHKEIH